jgi:hypothetical protein
MIRLFTGFFMLAIVLCLSFDAQAQKSSFDSFYGEQSVSSINVRLAPYLAGIDESSFDSEVLFSFNTESKKTEDREKWKYFYGLSLGGGGCGVHDADLGKYGKHDVTGGYGFVQFEAKYFENTTKKMRPFIGGALGLGSGSIWTKDAFTEDDPSGSMEMYKLGVEAGTHLDINNGYYLTLSTGIDALFLFYSDNASTVLPVYVSVGVSKWSGLGSD